MRSRQMLFAAAPVAAGLLVCATVGATRGSAAYALAVAYAGASQDSPIYEVRNYHFDPERFEEYAQVARGAYLAYLREHLDVVGFWIGTDVPAEVRGAPQDELGPANITWIIRWSSKAERDEKLPQVLSTPEWGEIFAEVPGGGASYLRIESRFMESLLD